MYQNYFIYNGEKYYSGSNIKINHIVYDGILKNQIKNGTFLYYDTKYKKYVYSVNEKKYFANEDEFYNKIVSADACCDNVSFSYNVNQMKESKIDSLFIGWIAYIVAMLFATMCNSRILLYVIISFVFFNYRKSKLKTEGYYYEW